MTRVLNMLNTLLPPSTCGQSISPTSCRPLKCDLNHRSTSLNVSPEITIAVVGPSGVGKSNFMQHALDLEKPPTTPVVFKKVSLDGSIFRVRLLEIDVESISFDDHSNEIIWPDVIEGHSIKDQPIDGVLNLFDSTDLTTITKHPRLHKVVMENQNPSITIACKCDSECLADEETFVSARRILGSVKVHQTASDEPTSQKRCISTIVGAVVRRSQFTDRSRSSLLSRRGILSLHTPMMRDSQFFHSSKWNNTLSTSKSTYPSPVTPVSPKSLVPTPSPATSASAPSPSLQNDLPTQATPGFLLSGQRSSSDIADGRSSHRLSTPRTLDSDFEGSKHSSDDIWSLKNESGVFHTKTRDTSDSSGEKLDQEQKNEDMSGQSSESRSIEETKRTQPSDRGQTFDELVDRLVAQPRSKDDIHFRFTFLCFYRLFATPKRLLLALIQRFEQKHDDDSFYISQFAGQIQVLEVLTQWVFEHPGDLSSHANKTRVKEFIATLEYNMLFAFSVKEISIGLQRTTEDLDSKWAVTTDTVRTQSSSASCCDTLDEDITRDNFYELDDDCHVASALDLEGPSEEIDNFSSRLSAVSFSSNGTHNSEGPSKEAISSWLQSDGDTQAIAEARSIEITDDLPLTKDMHRAFMDTEDEVIAHEIYRMDWVMYRAFGPREMFRYVKMPAAKKYTDDSVANVSRMVTTFNRLASFVVTMVLSRKKPKSRATTMEKFMRIAILLRQLNDYNSLGGVIAGLEQEPVHRLTQSLEMVDATVYKQFLSLRILMGHDRAYKPYRLAWGNTSSARICFLPLHLRDLTTGGEGNDTFKDSAHHHIKWRKFEILGGNLLQLHRSQTSPPESLRPKNQFIRSLILRTKVMDEMEEKFKRSVELECVTDPQANHKRRLAFALEPR